MKMTDLLRIINMRSTSQVILKIPIQKGVDGLIFDSRFLSVFIGVHLWLLLLFASGYVEAIERDVSAVRREYNDVSAAVDSLVRMMQVADAEVLKKLPEVRPERVLPEGMTAVMIFLGG